MPNISINEKNGLCGFTDAMNNAQTHSVQLFEVLSQQPPLPLSYFHKKKSNRQILKSPNHDYHISTRT